MGLSKGLKSLDYSRELRKFITSQYLFSGVRITAGVIIPAIILNRFGLLQTMIALPLGALCVSLTDSPGPEHHRRNSLIASLIINVFVLMVTGFVHTSPTLTIICIILFGLFFSLIGVYGNRVSSIGLIALVAFTFNVDGHMQGANLWQTCLYFSIGGVWYALLSMLLNTLRPYMFIQQLLGESLTEISNYLQLKSLFYKKDPNYDSLYNQMISLQVKIHQHQEDLREMLFKTRRIIEESTVRGRSLMMMFLDSVDLMESVMTSQQDYEELHKELDDTGMLNKYYDCIDAMAEELFEIGLAVQSGISVGEPKKMDETVQDAVNAFVALRKQELNSTNISKFIRLRQILYSIQDVAERIRRLRSFAENNKKAARKWVSELKPDAAVQRTEINPMLLVENLSLKSNHFRHALRVTLAMLTGYIISLLFPIGHGYWILLTIITIMKPAYSLTRQRNIHRLLGTVVGVIIGFIVLYFIKDATPLAIIMIIAMVLSYSFIKLNYFIGTACITVYVLVSFHFLSSHDFSSVIKDRMIDTSIGSAIAFFYALFVFPSWERGQIEQYLVAMLRANKNYFEAVTRLYTGSAVVDFKPVRKEAFVALANLSDNFQKILSEPKAQQKNLSYYHQLVASNHILTSYIASLSYYAQRTKNKYASADFEPLIEKVSNQMQLSIHLAEHKDVILPESEGLESPVMRRVNDLLEQRIREVETGQGEGDMTVRRTLSDLKTIAEQFKLINTIVRDEINVLKKLEKVA